MLNLTPDFDLEMEALVYRKISFEEFYVAASSVYQLEVREEWDEIAGKGFSVDEMA